MNRAPHTQPLRLRALDQRDRELMSQSAISSQLPITLPDGTVWTSVCGQCKACRTTIQDKLFTGRISLIGATAVVDAVGVCPPCRLATAYHYRLHEGLRVTGLTDQGWVVWQCHPAPLVGLLRGVSNLAKQVARLLC